MDRYRALRLTGGLLLAAGIVLLAWAAAEGQVSLALVLIVPVLYGAGPLAALSFVTIFAGIVLAFLSFFRSAACEDGPAAPEGGKEWSGVILIGPIPIVIGSAGMLKKRGALVLLTILSLLAMALFVLAIRR
jgi:uncharacterized membrane protein